MHIEEITEAFKEVVSHVAEISVNFMELLSICIIVFTTFVAFFKLLRHEKSARVYLLHGQSIGLTFKLGSEILRTITVRNMDEIMQIAMLILIKAAMTWLIHWELTDTDEEPDEPSSHAAHAHLEGVFGHARPNTTIIIEAGQNAHVETARPDDVDVQHRQRN
ncbi:DUF1622 domain-containing protein [Faecalibaculum rodentium]|jgi:uncharacterized membrane protein|uniref:DUF1622 domain-containing protein n=3 Tax=Faecalibaculum rodentium TaxID=1702221 RepID=A0A140DX61_9FIRM|nr:DUF1622 domain-containing protein [Faecalibaculum rodentium]AMK55238.1 hypothetical protein AALO17_21040 [Faecalibaculum rodentium]OLU46060.1 hypothetical protein BO223_02975 [Faecalibaculum rodentium]